MSDRLEKYVMENRAMFDTEEPGDEVWKVIHQKIRRNPFERIWKVAAVLLLFSTVYLIIDRNLPEETPSGETLADTIEFSQVEDYYTKLIAEKKAEITKYNKTKLKRSFLVEIERLDRMYEELKITYSKQNSTDMLIDAMISNLKLRIDILNQQLKILKKLNAAKDENEPSITI